MCPVALGYFLVKRLKASAGMTASVESTVALATTPRRVRGLGVPIVSEIEGMCEAASSYALGDADLPCPNFAGEAWSVEVVLVEELECRLGLASERGD